MRQQRERLGLTQAQLATRLGIKFTQQRVAKIEGAVQHVKLAEAQAFAFALDVPLPHLLAEKPSIGLARWQETYDACADRVAQLDRTIEDMRGVLDAAEVARREMLDTLARSAAYVEVLQRIGEETHLDEHVENLALVRDTMTRQLDPTEDNKEHDGKHQ